MIPTKMKAFIDEVLPLQTIHNRLQKEGPARYLEFSPLDVDRLQRLGIQVDKLGPHLVVCMWDEESPLEIGGYLVIDNLAMGQPSMGGIRMLPDITPAAIHNLARGMTLKNAAADLPYGGGKSGIVAPKGKLTAGEHTTIVRGFARLIRRYHTIYLPGPDVGTNDADMRTVALENGLNNALSKTADMGGNRIDQLGGAAQSVVVAIETLLEELPRLKNLPQFANMQVPAREDLSVLIQGFGAVGTHVARILNTSSHPPPQIIGISDASGYIFNAAGLPVPELLKLQNEYGVVTLPYFQEELNQSGQLNSKFANNCDDLLRESAFCLVPAAPIANYLDVDESSNPSMTVDHMGDWSLIVEGANTYSPAPTRRAARARMERTVYWQKGVLIATDFLVNSGGVIFAAQEHLIKAPDHLKIPDEMLGDETAVKKWLERHTTEFADLAEKRRLAGEAWVHRVIRRNMKELVDHLVADPDLLPCEAAEKIAIKRIAASESDRTVADVMAPILTILETQTIREAAHTLISKRGDLLAITTETGELTGVVTAWNVTQAVATGRPDDTPIKDIMTREVITASPIDSILEVVRRLEHYEISAVPVVTDLGVTGVVSSDILAQRTLYRLLLAQN